MNVGCIKRKMPEETSEIHFKVERMQRLFCMFSKGGCQCNSSCLVDCWQSEQCPVFSVLSFLPESLVLRAVRQH